MFLNKDTTVKGRVHPVKEFQAVILAGSRQQWGGLDILTDDGDAKRPCTLPKASLPVAGIPMIHYQLQWLEAARVPDVIVLCPQSSKDQVRMQVEKYEESSDLRMEVSVRDVPAGVDGTAQALRSIASLIKRDFIVMTCDVITDLPPHHLLDLHRIHGPTVTALLYDIKKLENATDRPNKQDEYAQYIGIDTASGRLVYAKAQEDTGESLRLRVSMLRKFPRLRVHTNLRDAHVYVFKRWVIDVIAGNDKIVSIRKDLLRYLVQCQYSKKAMKRERIDELLRANPDVFEEAQLLSTTSSYGIEKLIEEIRSGVYTQGVHEDVAQGSTDGSEEDSPIEREVVCAAVICRDRFCARANTVWSYGEINRQRAKSASEKGIGDMISKQTQVGPDSMIGEFSQIGDRCSIKKSVIGKHCVIGKHVKIVNSVLMDYVVLEDNVKLDGCIISQNAKILEKAQLKDCEVGPAYVVEKETVAKGEQFTESHFLDIDQA